MTTTVGNQTSRGRLPVHGRDRRPALAALALLLIVGGGLGAGLIVYRTGQQTDVLVANKAIHPGDVVTTDDMSTVRISGGSENTIAAKNEDGFVGTVALTNVPTGALLNRDMFHTKRGLMPTGGQTLGISLSTNHRPSDQFSAGDVVQAYYVTTNTAQGSSGPQTASKIASPLLVTAVHSSGGSTVVSVLVSDITAQVLAIPAVQGNVALTELPVGTKPELSLNGN